MADSRVIQRATPTPQSFLCVQVCENKLGTCVKMILQFACSTASCQVTMTAWSLWEQSLKKRQWLCFLCHIFKVMPQTLNFWKQNFARLFLLRQHHLWFSLNLQVQRGVTKSPKWKSVRDQIQPAYSFTYLCYILKTQWNKICFPVKLQRPAGVCSDFQVFKCG